MDDSTEFRRMVGAASLALEAGEDAVVDYLRNGVTPAATRDCDGYPGLAVACECPTFQGPVDTRATCAVHGPLYAEDGDACPCGDPDDCVECRPELVDYDVVVQGQAYTLRGSRRVSVRLLRAAALKRHVPPFQAYLDLGAVWEVRDAEGRVLESDSFVDAATVGRVYVDLRPGWGG